MKKLTTIFLASICFLYGGCSTLQGEESASPSLHVHAFYEASTKAATCLEDGYATLRCSCGAYQTEIREEALGHQYAEESTSPSRLRPCVREGCTCGLLPAAQGGTSRECTYTADTAAAMDAQYAALLQQIEEVGGYDEGCLYEEGSVLAQKNEAFETALTAYERALKDLGAQYQYGQLAYHGNMQDEELAAQYNEVHQYYNTSVGNYYGLYQKVYDSGLRNYFYYGLGEEEIQGILEEYGGYSNEEILALENANVELTMAFYEIDPAEGEDVLQLYGQFVENNKQIATLSGYENYMAYAYAELYEREYAYTAFDEFYERVITYITPLFDEFYEEFVRQQWKTNRWTEQESFEYGEISAGSFFYSVYANETVNDFMELLQVPLSGGTLSYAERLGTLLQKGDYFLGEYEGAYTWKLEKEGVPIVYFGGGYQNPFTVVHEFGHYMNYVANGNGEGSFDLMETHSQGLEMLFLYFLQGELSAGAYSLLKTEMLLEGLSVVACAASVNKFEQAVYTDCYDGLNGDILMADGRITPDEYDFLYESIQREMGIYGVINGKYWRYVTLLNPCYYVSYAVSMACSMQLYIKAETEGLDKAIDAYLKTVARTKEQKDWTYREILVEAGLLPYDDEGLYQGLYEWLRLAE